MKNRRWTSEEIEYLTCKWGNMSIDNIAKKLNRSVFSIENKKNKLGLGRFTDNNDKVIPKSVLFNVVFKSGSISYKDISLVKNRGLKTHTVKRSKNFAYEGINIEEFFEWAYENRSFLDFSNFEKNALGYEPEWVDIKRRQDTKKNIKFTKEPWTKKEDETLKRLLKKYKYTYKELSALVHRTEGAIQRRICDLKIKERPIKENNHIKWTDDEYKMLGEMIKQCFNYEEMSEKLNKSTKAIRGRVYQYYLTESLDKVRKMIGNDNFFDNTPEKQLKHKNLFTAEERRTIDSLLSNLVNALDKRIAISKPYCEQFEDYFQKDMCQHWSEFKGCLKKENNCDECTFFKRKKVENLEV